MKQAKQRQKTRIKPRSKLAINPLLRKGGAHQRKDKLASRARQKARWQRQDAG